MSNVGNLLAVNCFQKTCGASILTTYGTLVSNQIVLVGVSQVLVKDAIQAKRFILVSLDSVLNVLRGIPRKVVALAYFNAHQHHARMMVSTTQLSYLALDPDQRS